MRVELRAHGVAKPARLGRACLAPAPVPGLSSRNADGETRRRLPCGKAIRNRLDDATSKIGVINPCHCRPPSYQWQNRISVRALGIPVNDSALDETALNLLDR